MTKTTEPRDLYLLRERTQALHYRVVRMEGVLLFMVILQLATVLLIVLL